MRWRAKWALVYKTAPVPALFVSEPLKFHVCCRGLGWSFSTIQPQLSGEKTLFLYLQWRCSSTIGGSCSTQQEHESPPGPSTPAFFFDLLTRFSRLSFVLRVLHVQEDALWISGEPCIRAPAKLTSVPFLSSPLQSGSFCFFLLFPNNRSVCSLNSFTCSQAHTCLPAIQHAQRCLQAGWARPGCLPRTLPVKPLPHLSTARCQNSSLLNWYVSW